MRNERLNHRCVPRCCWLRTALPWCCCIALPLRRCMRSERIHTRAPAPALSTTRAQTIPNAPNPSLPPSLPPRSFVYDSSMPLGRLVRQVADKAQVPPAPLFLPTALCPFDRAQQGGPLGSCQLEKCTCAGAHPARACRPAAALLRCTLHAARSRLGPANAPAASLPSPADLLPSPRACPAQVGTQRSWKRPYGVGLIVAGHDESGAPELACLPELCLLACADASCWLAGCDECGAPQMHVPQAQACHVLAGGRGCKESGCTLRCSASLCCLLAAAASHACGASHTLTGIALCTLRCAGPHAFYNRPSGLAHLLPCCPALRRPPRLL